jgi:catechol 2,3-dioxygenase-like lactoylglutathione lyase family enzyme
MPVHLNHTIVPAVDAAASATFLTEILGLDPPVRFAHFHVVEVANGVSLDFDDTPADEIRPTHFAFLVSEDEFDGIFGRVQERGLTYWPGPSRSNPGNINHHDGGRGFYFEDPSGHFLEVITRPYGGG